MNLQYISDSAGNTTGVFIHITEWNQLKAKFKGIEKELIDIPEWQKNEVRKRLADYDNNPEQAINFDTAINEIEKNH